LPQQPRLPLASFIITTASLILRAAFISRARHTYYLFFHALVPSGFVANCDASGLVPNALGIGDCTADVDSYGACKNTPPSSGTRGTRWERGLY
jgi:hypothetical protein